MPILGVIASSITAGLSGGGGSYESIATVNVGAGGSSSVSFTSIPSTYTHLQVRILTRSTFSAADWPVWVNPNNDATSSYSYHGMIGDGATLTGFAGTNQSLAQIGSAPAGTALANTFGMFVIDILDYTNTNKYKTMKSLYGFNAQTAGILGMRSALWMKTDAITSLYFGTASNFAQYSQFALYGIKVAV